MSKTGPPNRLLELSAIKIKAGEHNVLIDLLNGSSDVSLPLGNNFTWNKNGHLLDSQEEGISVNYSSLLFSQIRVNDSGNYSLSLISHFQDDLNWTDRGGFVLHVLCKSKNFSRLSYV